MAVEIPRNRDWREPCEPGLKPSAGGEDCCRGGWQVFAEKCCLCLCPFVFSGCSFLSSRRHSCPSQGVPEVTTLLSRHTPPDRFLIRQGHILTSANFSLRNAGTFWIPGNLWFCFKAIAHLVHSPSSGHHSLSHMHMW